MSSNYAYIFFLAGVLVSCTSTVVITSDPTGAEIFVSQQKSTKRESLGKAPITVDYTDIYNKSGSIEGSDLILLSAELKGYESQKILIPSAPFGLGATNVQILMPTITQANSVGNILQYMHNSQKFAQSGQFERAHIEIDKVLNLDPSVVRALSLKASIFYLERKFDQSLIWFEKAIALDPSFDEAVKMINKIKTGNAAVTN